MSDSEKKALTEEWLAPAECAKRTGLTIRALRVYERYGLVTALRLDNGWRVYGARELERLNAITALKTLGMKLVQIRDLLRDKEPSLERVLEIQVKAWKVKKAEAERGLILADAALKRVQRKEALSVDAICKLIRGFETISDQLLVIRELLNERLTPQEMEAVREFMKLNYNAEHVKRKVVEETGIFKRMRELMDAGATPESDDVQRLLIERNQLESRYGGPDRALKMIEWNREIGLKFFSIEARTLKKMRSQPASEHDPRMVMTPQLWDFFTRANKLTPWAQAIMKLLADTRDLLLSDTNPASTEAQALARRFRETYTEYSLGDPDVTAKLVPYWEALHDGWPEWAGEENRSAWLFLSEAVVHGLAKRSTSTT